MDEPLSRLISSAAASLARTLALLEQAQGLTVPGPTCGSSSHGSSKKRNRRGSSSKTLQPFALADWTAYSGRLLRSGLMRSGIVYPRPPLVPLTRGTASGLLPTPRSASVDRGGRGDLLQAVRGNTNGHFSPPLWPTPTVNGNNNRKEYSPKAGDGLATAVKLWPTPVADDTGYRKSKYAQGGTALSTVTGGPLNPEWVEWLLGFPVGWTDLGP